MEKNSIILFSSSAQFLDVTEKNLRLHNLKIKSKISNLNILKNIDINKKDLFIVQLQNRDEHDMREIINFFRDNNLNWICVSNHSSINFEAIKNGAISQICLKERPSFIEFRSFINILISKIKDGWEITNIINSKVNKEENNNYSYEKVVAIGGSTGGTEAVQNILMKLKKDVPPILVVLHMPPSFTAMYANRLNDICKMRVKEAEDGDIIKAGIAFIAPGGYQMKVKKNESGLYISCKKEEKVNGHAPSVDVLFESVAKYVANKSISVILTGMGNDGAIGTLKIKQSGGFTIGQDKESSVVYGMPKVAYDIGGIIVQSHLDNIHKIILDNI